jgi:hypothetical protein
MPKIFFPISSNAWWYAQSNVGWCVGEVQLCSSAVVVVVIIMYQKKNGEFHGSKTNSEEGANTCTAQNST